MIYLQMFLRTYSATELYELTVLTRNWLFDWHGWEYVGFNQSVCFLYYPYSYLILICAGYQTTAFGSIIAVCSHWRICGFSPKTRRSFQANAVLLTMTCLEFGLDANMLSISIPNYLTFIFDFKSQGGFNSNRRHHRYFRKMPMLLLIE